MKRNNETFKKKIKLPHSSSKKEKLKEQTEQCNLSIKITTTITCVYNISNP